MFDIDNGIAVVAFDNPPVNSLGHALRDSIVRKLEAAQAHPEVRAVVLTGSERAFSAGADVSVRITYDATNNSKQAALKTLEQIKARIIQDTWPPA